MPSSCSVQGCKERNTGIHCLPVKDIERGKTWLVAIKIPNYNENTSLEQWKNIRVCSKHFKSEDFKTDLKNTIVGARSRTILKDDAIPSIFPWTFDSQRSSRETSPPQGQSPVETTSQFLCFLADVLVTFECWRCFHSSGSMRRSLQPTQVAQVVQLIQDGTSMRAVARRFAIQNWAALVIFCFSREQLFVREQRVLYTQLLLQDGHGQLENGGKKVSNTAYAPSTAPYDESCPEITFDVSELTFATDEENNCSIEEEGEAEENNCSNEAREEEEEEENEEEIDDRDSDWEKDDSDQLESDDSDESDFNLDSELHKNVRQLCPECGAFFFTCKAHTCEYKIKPFSCNDCGKRCVDKSALKAHSIIHKESYEHPCKFCLAPFKTRLDKLAHEGAHVPSAKPYKCPDCSLTFAKLHARNRHLKGHRGPKIFSCPHCALEFRSANHMERHIVVHTGMKQYACEFCSRSFNQQSHLKSHLRVHTGEKPFQCQYCDKSFNHNVSLKSHVMRNHKEGASDFGPSGPVKRTKRAILQSMGRPKGRPKRNAATGETNSIPAVRGEALDPTTAAETSEKGHLRRPSSKDIERDWSDRNSTSELTEEDKTEESKEVRKSKRKASQRPKTYYIAEKDFESDSDSNPEEEAKKRKVVKSQET
ncbi:unnamed protein product [Lota lota]